jgi:hypothetical protein
MAAINTGLLTNYGIKKHKKKLPVKLRSVEVLFDNKQNI